MLIFWKFDFPRSNESNIILPFRQYRLRLVLSVKARIFLIGNENQFFALRNGNFCNLQNHFLT